MIRIITFLMLIPVYFIISSCTGYGLLYEDKHLTSSDSELHCLNNINSECLLSVALEISAEMADQLARAEALKIIAKVQFEIGHHAAALKTISAMPITAMQFTSLSELVNTALQHNKNTQDLLDLAASITAELQQPKDRLAAIILSAILHFEVQQADKAKQRVQQAIELANSAITDGDNIIDALFFNSLLPKLLKFETDELIAILTRLPVKPAVQISAQVEYTIQLKQASARQSDQSARQQQQQVLNIWHQLAPQARQLAQPAIIKLLVNFNKLALARKIRDQQTDVMDSVTLSAVIIRQLTAKTKIASAKTELVRLLQDVRSHTSLEDMIIKQQPRVTKVQLNKYYADKFKLDNLRALAIADLALALSETGKIPEAVHFAEQIQRSMGHIQGSTLTKLALKYAQQGDINSALLTMESIHRPVNRAACLAQISAILAKKGKVARAIRVANRVDRLSWRDIAFSEISIAQARQNKLNSALTTLKTIQRSYSTIYAMTGIARTLQARQNKR